MELISPPTDRPTLMGTKHMVVAGHHLAAAAAYSVLESGGNAVDAGVAGGFALNVVQADMANLGGVAPIILYPAATGEVTTISGVGRWPAGATLDAIGAAGGGVIPLGPHRWVTPAAVDAWLTALERYGTMTVGEVLAPAIELATDGFPANYFIRHNLLDARDRMLAWSHSREVFFPHGRAPEIGEPIVQSALAGTLRHLADAERTAGGTREQGVRAARDAFYTGDVAEEVGAFAREIGALLRAEDMRSFRVREEPPVSTSYRGSRVYACGPWSQGPAVLQMLNVLEGFDLAALDDALRAHVTIEAVHLALADRNRWYGDPDVVSVPMERLLSKRYGEEQRAQIRMDRATPSPHGRRPGRASRDTTYLCVVDRFGNAFSATPSDSTILHTPMVPGLGFAPSDRGLQASLDPADPNSVAPGKRPRLTPNPGLVLGPGSVMPYGTPGGDVQTQAMVQVLVNLLDRGASLQEAVSAPRWASYSVPLTEDPHPAVPNLVRLELALFDAVGPRLEALGHEVEAWPERSAYAGGVCVAHRDDATGVVAGGADPRRMSYAIGW